MNLCSLNNYNNNKYNVSFGKKIPINAYGNVSIPFVKEIQSSIAEYPQTILSKILKDGLIDDIRIATKASNAFPEFPDLRKQLKEETVHGVLPPMTWDDFLAGVAVSHECSGKLFKILGFFESPSSVYTKANKGTVGHELSHKVDEWLKNLSGVKISQTDSFKNAARKDIEQLPERLKLNPYLHQKWGEENINYLTQSSTSDNLNTYGLGEIFAECGAANTTGTASEISIKAKFMKNFFPESYQYVQKFLYLMGMRK